MNSCDTYAPHGLHGFSQFHLEEKIMVVNPHCHSPHLRRPPHFGGAILRPLAVCVRAVLRVMRRGTLKGNKIFCDNFARCFNAHHFV